MMLLVLCRYARLALELHVEHVDNDLHPNVTSMRLKGRLKDDYRRRRRRHRRGTRSRKLMSKLNWILTTTTTAATTTALVSLKIGT